jgi:hypothetical protein
MLKALEEDRYEAAFGQAENMRARREALFDAMNR